MYARALLLISPGPRGTWGLSCVGVFGRAKAGSFVTAAAAATTAAASTVVFNIVMIGGTQGSVQCRYPVARLRLEVAGVS